MQTMKRFIFILIFAFSYILLHSENIITFNMETAFMFEKSEYDNVKSNSTIIPIGMNIKTRYYSKNNFLGFIIQGSVLFPIEILSEMGDILDSNWGLYDGGYDSAIIFGFGSGLSFRYGYFIMAILDIGVNAHIFSIKNSNVEYLNISGGLFTNLSTGFDFGFAVFEIGISGGWDILSSSKIKLSDDTLKYRGGYNMPYFSLFTGLGFSFGQNNKNNSW
jgi:hypothetical protein